MAVSWRPTNTPAQTRYDDIWFISPQGGRGVNSAICGISSPAR
jgi:hypothetical protein